MDAFDDIRTSRELNGYGSLSGDGIDSHEQVSSSLAKDGNGIDYIVECGECGSPNQVNVSWKEFLLGANNRVPFDERTGIQWRYEQQYGGFQPNVGCARCRMAIMLILTPEECRRMILQAEQMNALPRGWLQQGSQALQSQLTGYTR